MSQVIKKYFIENIMKSFAFSLGWFVRTTIEKLMADLMDRTVAYQATGSLNTISWCFEHEKWINSYHLRRWRVYRVGRQKPQKKNRNKYLKERSSPEEHKGGAATRKYNVTFEKIS